MSRWLIANMQDTDITAEIIQPYNKDVVKQILGDNTLVRAIENESENDSNSSQLVEFTFSDNISLDTFKKFLDAIGYKLSPEYTYNDAKEDIDVSVSRNLGVYHWTFSQNK